MRRVGWVIAVVVVMGCAAVGQSRTFRGTVVRMRMSECTQRHGFVSKMSGTEIVTTQACSEYTVLTDKVVYVISGRKPEAFIPLAENVIFHLRKNDLVVISEEEKRESHFSVREMMLREAWDRNEQRPDVMTRWPERRAEYEEDASQTALMQTRAH